MNCLISLATTEKNLASFVKRWQRLDEQGAFRSV